MEAVKKRKEFICEKCDPPCIIRASEEVEIPKVCPFGRKEAEWRERKDEEKKVKLNSWKIKPLNCQKLKEALCVDCFREVHEALQSAISLYEEYESAPGELLMRHPEFATTKITVDEDLREFVRRFEKEYRYCEEKAGDTFISLIGSYLCYNGWLFDLAFGISRRESERWVERGDE